MKTPFLTGLLLTLFLAGLKGEAQVSGTSSLGFFKKLTLSVCAEAGGKTVNGSCWFLGSLGNSCTATCSSFSGFSGVHSDTIYFAGSEGSLAQCKAVLDAFSETGTNNVGDQAHARGCQFRPDNMARKRGTTLTDYDASNANWRRACACLENGDKEPKSIDWPDFQNLSISQTFIDLNETISLEMSAVDQSGTPDLEYQINSDGWIAFSSSSPATISIQSGDALSFQISGTTGDQAEITIKNLSVSGTPVLDTTVGNVVSDPCNGSPNIGDTCLDGPIYAGEFAGSDYMVTPGNCTNSSTPTCDDTTDTLTLAWGSYSTTNVTDPMSGKINSATLASLGKQAAQYCENMIYGGHSDWFLPAENELSFLYDNKTAIGGFANNAYWSSTELDYWEASYLNFSDGNQNHNYKSSAQRVRCVRRMSDAPYLPFFKDLTGLALDQVVESELGYFKGVTGTLSVSVAGDGNSQLQINGGAWVTSATVSDGDSIKIRMTTSASSFSSHTATLTANSTNITWTLTTGAPDDCATGSPAIGDNCSSGTVYAGEFAGSGYMVTPGNCTNSATPTCDGAMDNLTKSWGPYTLTNITSPSTGKTNSPALAALGSAYQAARFCDDMQFGGYTDWFLPSIDELRMLYRHRAAIGGFPDDYYSSTYWSSTESTQYNAENIEFITGLNDSSTQKTYGYLVRCMRRINQDALYVPSFRNLTNIEPNKTVTSEASSVGGFSGTLTLTVSGSGSPQFQVNGGAWVTSATVSSGDLIVARMTTSNLPLQTHQATFLLGTASSDWSITTYTPTDCTTGTPAPGDYCSTGAVYAGSLDGVGYMTTPSGCSDSASPFCDNLEDQVKRYWDMEYSYYGTGPWTSAASSPKAGQVNAPDMIANAPVAGEAPSFCENLTYAGYSDWFLPALEELELLYQNKAAINLTPIGAPEYGSSTQYDDVSFYSIAASDGQRFMKNYDNEVMVRCVRRMENVPYLLTVDNLTNQPTTTSVKTREVLVGGFTGSLALSTSGDGSPELQVNDGSWMTSTTVASGDKVRFRMTTPAAEGETSVVNIQFGSQNLNWQVTTLTGVDCINQTPAIGTVCSDGSLYAGQYNGVKYATLPSGCESDPDGPTCMGHDRTFLMWGAHEVVLNVYGTEDGLVNTVKIASHTDTDAAQYCQNMVYGGHADWFLPAENELVHIATQGSALSLRQDTLANSVYLSSTESPFYSSLDSRDVQVVYGNGAGVTDSSRVYALLVRCARLLTSSPTTTPFEDVNNAPLSEQITSAISVVSGFSGTQTASVSGDGAPQLRVNGGTWVTSAPVTSGDSIELRLTSSSTEGVAYNATVSLATYNTSWTVTTYTSVDCSTGSPSVGDVCSGGAVYAGIFNSAKYMVTPGGCTDSPNPICVGQDFVKKQYGPSVANYTAENRSDGQANTDILDANYTPAEAEAAHYCADMSFGGYSDWFLPSIDELQYMYGIKDSLDSGMMSAEYISSTQDSLWVETNFTWAGYQNTPYFLRCVRKF